MWYASDEPMPSTTSTPNAVVPLAVQLRGQRLAGRRAQPQAAQVLCGRLGVGDHRAHHRRHVHQDRRPVAGDQLEDPVGRGALGERDARAADAERVQRGEVAGVAEEQLRHRQHDVVRAEVEHAAGVAVVAEHRARRGVHARLGRAGAAGGELPDRDVVLRGRRGVQGVRRLRGERAQVVLVRAEVGVADDQQAVAALATPRASGRASPGRPRRPRRRCSRGSSGSPWPAGTCTPRR